MLARHQYELEDWERRYQSRKKPIVVDFRSLVEDAVRPERYTHLLHPYPAKLLPQIPYFFLRSSLASGGSEQTVVDPFCGSGTVLLEAVLCGHQAIGADTNPLARLISKVKITPVSDSSILAALNVVNAAVPKIRQAEAPPVVNLATWFQKDTIIELAKLRLAIKEVKAKGAREFLQLCLSVCVRKLSLADPRLSVPVRINASRKKKYGPHYRQLKAHLEQIGRVSAIARFNETVVRNAARMKSFREATPATPRATIFDDARILDHHVPPSSVDLIITSPPYAGAQKYIRTSSLSLGWLDFAYEGELRALERKTIGREHFSKCEVGTLPKSGIQKADRVLKQIEELYPLRAHIAQAYLAEMRQALQSMHAILKPGGNLVLVTGPNTICGFQFDTPSYIQALAHATGFETRFCLIDHIRSRGLMTKRNKTASIISSEVVLCMRKIT